MVLSYVAKSTELSERALTGIKFRQMAEGSTAQTGSLETSYPIWLEEAQDFYRSFLLGEGCVSKTHERGSNPRRPAC